MRRWASRVFGAFTIRSNAKRRPSSSPAAATRAFLATDEYGPEVDAAQRAAHERGVNGVPLFVFNGRYALSGAHPVEVFHEVFEVVEREYTLQSVGSGE